MNNNNIEHVIELATAIKAARNEQLRLEAELTAVITGDMKPITVIATPVTIDSVAKTPTEEKVLKVLGGSKALRAKEVARKVGINAEAAAATLGRMYRSGLLTREARGLYKVNGAFH